MAEEKKSESEDRGQRKERVGLVVSDKMKNTVVVRVVRTFAHPLYRKYMRRNKKFYAHDAENRCHVGDTVRIVETRPISKLKRWKVAAILERAK